MVKSTKKHISKKKNGSQNIMLVYAIISLMNGIRVMYFTISEAERVVGLPPLREKY